MRDDLTGALAAVDWADAHIPVMNERFIAWKRRSPYNIIIEPDSEDAEWELLVAYHRVPLDPLIHGDVGAFINSMRTALDTRWCTDGLRGRADCTLRVRMMAACGGGTPRRCRGSGAIVG
jgi:hypothetical protein